MRHYCTYFDANYLTRGLALYESLRAHAGEFTLTVLCMDDATAATLRARALPGVRPLPIQTLVARHTPLAGARGNRTKLEFYFTCTSWLMFHLLSAVPRGELLTYLDADMYFFSSPDPIYAEIGDASIGITPHRFPESLAHLVRYGKYNVGWVSMRHDAAGLACAADWSERCAAWCFNRYEDDRYADQKYLDAWEEKFVRTRALAHPGVNLAPWNVKDSRLEQQAGQVCVNGAPLIFYHFHALAHLDGNLWDPSLHKYDAEMSDGLRDFVYLPYLRKILPSDAAPEVIPPRSNTPAVAISFSHVLRLLRASELDRGKRLIAIDEGFIALQNANADLQKNIAYIREVERDSAERLRSIQFYQEKLKTAYDDLERNVAYLKTLEAEIAAHVKVSAEKDQIIASLNQQLQQATSQST